MADTVLDQDTILRTVRTWPREQREQLARSILMDNGQDTIDPQTGRPYVSSEELRGLLAIPGRPAPTDEDIERLRMEKYGE